MATYNAFKKMCVESGLDAKRFGLHSMRVGAATDAYLRGVPGNVIDFRGRWKSENTKKRYCRPTVDNLLKANR
jgi:hypothetical protein